MKLMRWILAGKTDPAIQERVDMFRHRVVQEFYDLEKDPGCTKNLMASPEHKELIAKYQKRLREWMVETDDHCIKAFDVREGPVKLAEEVKNYPKLVKPKAAGQGDGGEEKSEGNRRGAKETPRRASKGGGGDEVERALMPIWRAGLQPAGDRGGWRRCSSRFRGAPNFE